MVGLCILTILTASAADPGCLFRILILSIPDLRFRISDPGSQIPDPGVLDLESWIPYPTATKEEGENFVVLPFSVATNITKFKIILVLNM
jgi:hypothetical protein